MSEIKKKNKFNFRKSRNKYFLAPGFRGFFCTCNFKEKDCVKEAYNVLNEYAIKLYPNIETDKDMIRSDSGSEDDIGDVLRRELEKMKKDSQKSLRHKRFQAVETGTSNCIFIKTNLPHPEEVTSAILHDLSSTKVQKTRYLMRMLPIMATCKANLPDIMESAGYLFDKYFLKEPSSFAIVFNRRFNNSLCRDLLIKELAELIILKNMGNKADLKNPQLCVIVEVIKNICLLSIVENYYGYKKYNLLEICKDEPKIENDEPEAKKLKLDNSSTNGDSAEIKT